MLLMLGGLMLLTLGGLMLLTLGGLTLLTLGGLMLSGPSLGRCKKISGFMIVQSNVVSVERTGSTGDHDYCAVIIDGKALVEGHLVISLQLINPLLLCMTLYSKLAVGE